MHAPSQWFTLPVGSLVLVPCAPPSGLRITLAIAKAYGGDLADALSVVADTYLADPSQIDVQIVTSTKNALQHAKAVLDATTFADDAMSAIKHLIGDAQVLYPLVAFLLESDSLYVPMAINVLDAFVACLPLPPRAPCVPPAAFHRRALQYNHAG